MTAYVEQVASEVSLHKIPEGIRKYLQSKFLAHFKIIESLLYRGGDRPRSLPVTVSEMQRWR